MLFLSMFIVKIHFLLVHLEKSGLINFKSVEILLASQVEDWSLILECAYRNLSHLFSL